VFYLSQNINQSLKTLISHLKTIVMININKRWLLTASPWMMFGRGPAPLGIKRIFLIALLIAGCQAAIAQSHPSTAITTGGTVTTSDLPVGPVGGTPAPELPLITGGTTICVGTTTVLSNTVAGGTWTSANTAIATVNSSTGLVNGVHGGVVVITYAVGVYSTTTTITVTQPIVGSRTLCTGNIMLLTDSTYTGNWGSSNPAVATVVPVSIATLATGQVTGVSAGTAIITYGRTGACFMTDTVVVGSNGVAAINGTGVLGVCAGGGTMTLTDATPGGTWSSSTPAIASIGSASGIVTGGTAAGTSTITYTVAGGCYVTRNVVVTTVSAISPITPASPTVCIGSTTALSDATSLGTWSSANPAAATINSSGIVTGVALGTAVISYSKGGCSKTTTVTVNTNTTGAITGNLSVCIGTPGTLSSSPSGGTWTSSAPSFATVGSASGIVTGVLSGYAIITYSQGGCFKTATVTVNPATSIGAISGTATVCQGSTTTLTDAVPGGVWSVSTPASGTISTFGVVTAIGAGTDTVSYTRLGCVIKKVVTVNPIPLPITGTARECNANINSAAALSELTGGGSWSSSNTAIATVGSTGIVTGVATGQATISYSLVATGCYVTVKDSVYGPVAISGGNTACIALASYLELEDATFGGVWSSQNTTLATISSAGAVSPNLPGVDTVLYTVTYFPGFSCYASKAVTINYDPGLISGNSNVCQGSTTTLSDTASGGLWSTNNVVIASIGSTTGIVTGNSAGAVVISYTKNGCTRTANIVVASPPDAISMTGTLCAGYSTATLTDSTTGGVWSKTNPSVSINTVLGNPYIAVVTGWGVAGSGGGGWTGAVDTIMYTIGGCTTTKIVTINPNSLGTPTGSPEVCQGATTTVVYPSPGTGSWSSQHPSVATVGAATGIVTGLSAGATAITYTSAGGCIKTFEMTVADSPHTIVGAWSVCAGAVTTLSGEAGLGGGWITSNSAVASIDTGGNVTGASAGTATITYAIPGGCAVYHNMTVLSNPLAIGGSVGVCTSGPLVYTATDKTLGGTWSISDPTKATLSSSTGTVSGTTLYDTLTGVAAGTPVITYTGSNGCYVTETITVNATPTAAISGGTTTCVNSVLQLSDASGAGLGTWTSGTTSKATISTTGLVSGVAAGTSAITYNYNGCMAALTVTVSANNVGAIIDLPLVCLADTTTLFDTTAGGTWSSSNTAVATIGTSGLVTGVAAGFTTITYTAANGCMVYSSPITVIGSMPAITGPTTVCKSATTYLYDSLSANGVWTSSAPATASVGSASGLVTGVAAGGATITFTATGCVQHPATYTFSVLATPASITPSTKNVCVGGVFGLTVVGGQVGSSWTSSDNTLATVASSSPFGTTANVTGVAAGVPYITYMYPDGCFVASTVTVGAPPSVITGSQVCTSNAYTFTDSVSGGSWSSTATGVATIDATLGIVNGISAGTDTIKYTTPGCPFAFYLVTVNTAPAPITGTFSVCKLSTTTLADTSSGGTWTSSNTALATIGSATGVVTGVSGGTLNITYTVANGCMDVQSFYVDPCGLKNGNEPAANTAAEQVYTLFPNPTNGNISITQSIPVDGDMQVTVLNAVGAKVYAGPVAFSGGLGRLSISAASGMYLVLLQDNNHLVQTFKVIIEK